MRRARANANVFDILDGVRCRPEMFGIDVLNPDLGGLKSMLHGYQVALDRYRIDEGPLTFGALQQLAPRSHTLVDEYRALHPRVVASVRVTRRHRYVGLRTDAEERPREIRVIHFAPTKMFLINCVYAGGVARDEMSMPESQTLALAKRQVRRDWNIEPDDWRHPRSRSPKSTKAKPSV